jgi:hypothetical protein
MTSSQRFEWEETEAAATEAAQIGGVAGDEDFDPAERAVIEGGGGDGGGFEEAEQALIEHASHGDQQSAHTILHDQGKPEEPLAGRQDSEADEERSSEVDESG